MTSATRESQPRQMVEIRRAFRMGRSWTRASSDQLTLLNIETLLGSVLQMTRITVRVMV